MTCIYYSMETHLEEQPDLEAPLLDQLVFGPAVDLQGCGNLDRTAALARQVESGEKQHHRRHQKAPDIGRTLHQPVVGEVVVTG